MLLPNGRPFHGSGPSSVGKIKRVPVGSLPNRVTEQGCRPLEFLRAKRVGAPVAALMAVHLFAECQKTCKDFVNSVTLLLPQARPSTTGSTVSSLNSKTPITSPKPGPSVKATRHCHGLPLHPQETLGKMCFVPLPAICLTRVRGAICPISNELIGS